MAAVRGRGHEVFGNLHVTSPRTALHSASVELRSLPNAPEVWSVDDSPAWLSKTSAFLAKHGLSTERLVTLDDFVRHRQANFDLVFYDLGTIDRRAALMRWAAGKVGERGAFLFDDYNRPAVRDAASKALFGWAVSQAHNTRDVYERFAGLAFRPGGGPDQIPIIVICRDRLTGLTRLVDWLERAGQTNIVFVDNDSTYPPLVEYLRATPYTVIAAGRNAGHTAPWEFAREFMTGPYVVTDPDVLPVEECPPDAIDHFRRLLDLMPDVDKVGFSLKTDDLPDCYAHAATVRAWESQFWKDRDPHFDVYRGAVDTTFALYRPGPIDDPNRPVLTRAVRSAPPYTARHLPWYADSSNPTEEERYYRQRMDPGISHWSREISPYTGCVQGRPTEPSVPANPPGDKPLVVYHVAAMGEWQKVVREQLRLLRDVGLSDVRVTHVGLGLEWLCSEAAGVGVKVEVVRSDPNTDHYETFAMLEVERLAKVEKVVRPILYLHTKGVSAPFEEGRSHKQLWRRAMEDYLVRPWRQHVRHIADGGGYDAVGFCWYPHGDQHFSGNFWMARPDWIRRLPDFAWYHGRRGLSRYSCESWIGAQQWCRAYSLGVSNQVCSGFFDFASLLPVPAKDGLRLNLGCGPFYAPGWVNLDLDRSFKADVYGDAVELPGVAPNTVDEIYVGHLAEHVGDIEVALGRWFEVLKPGGVVTVTVPDGDGSVKMWRAGQPFAALGCDASGGLLGVATGYRTREESDADPAGFQRHRRLFDRSVLHLCLKAAGFRGVREVDGHALMFAPCSRLGWQIAAEGTKPG